MINITQQLLDEAYACAASGGIIDVPHGDWEVTQKIIINTTGKVIVRGHGRLTWTCPDGGIDITYNDIHRAPEVVGLTLQTACMSGAGNSLVITAPVVASGTDDGPLISNVNMRGFDTGFHTWDNGLKLVNCWNPIIDAFTFKGQDDATSPFIAGAGIILDRCQVPHLNNIFIWHCENAVIQLGDSFGEGFRLEGFEFVGVTNGINLYSSSAGNGSYIGAGHINAYARGIVMANRPWMTISKCLIIKTHVSNMNWVGIEALNCSRITIEGNQIYGQVGATGPNTGIFIYGPSTEYGLLVGNRIGDFPQIGQGIFYAIGAHHNVIMNNIGFWLAGGAIVCAGKDAGAGNVETGNYLP